MSAAVAAVTARKIYSGGRISKFNMDFCEPRMRRRLLAVPQAWIHFQFLDVTTLPS